MKEKDYKAGCVRTAPPACLFGSKVAHLQDVGLAGVFPDLCAVIYHDSQGKLLGSCTHTARDELRKHMCHPVPLCISCALPAIA
eukprot:scaffold101820_cov25-Tisochrysis_lutea.AAC.1